MFGSKIKREEGQAIVEFAIVIPFFILLLVAIMELGWISYQTNLFNYGYSHAAWDVTAEALGEEKPYEVKNKVEEYKGAKVDALIADTIEQGALWGFDKSKLSVQNASAKMYSEDSIFMVPGKDPSLRVEATTITRYMEINAKLKYEIKPLTGIGSTFFSKMLVLEKDLNSLRTVGALKRSE